MSDAPGQFEDAANAVTTIVEPIVEPLAAEPLIDAGDESTLTQKLVAEAFGAFLLVLFGCGAAVFSTIFALHMRAPSLDLSFITTVALAFGFAFVIAAYAFGRISGGHFNPAISLGAALSGRLPWVTAGYYAIAQVVGGIVAALVLWILAHGFHGYGSTTVGIGANGFGSPVELQWWAAFLFELVMTAILVAVALAATDARNRFPALAPLTIGLTLTAIYFVGIPGDGASVNPARSIGPALFADNRAAGQLWLFILAPLIGGAIGGLVYPAVFGRDVAALPGSGWELVVERARVARDRAQAQRQAQRQAQQQAQQQAQHDQQQSGRRQNQQPWQGLGAHPSHPGELPVIEQDGWRWSYETQQWVPIPLGEDLLGPANGPTPVPESEAEQTAMRPPIPPDDRPSPPRG